MTTWANTPKQCRGCQIEFLPARWNQFYCGPCRAKCSVEGCSKPMASNGLCVGHRFQMKKHGRIVSIDLREPRGDQKHRSARSETLTLKCQGCGVEFRVPQGIAVNKAGEVTRKFCTKACMIATLDPKPKFDCAECGKTTSRRKNPVTGGYDYRTVYCSTTCQHRSMFKGGFIDKSGYRITTIGGVSKPEHRRVMERIIGRPLLVSETVHHRDGNRLNNEPSNLELFSSRHPKGQRLEEKLEFCRSFLKDYGIDVPTLDVSDFMSGALACL